jgi:hypothetical protein
MESPLRFGSSRVGTEGDDGKGRLGRWLGRGCLLGQAGFGWVVSSQLGRAGVGDCCWVGLGFRPGFGPQPMLILKIPFLFPNLFIICKLI